ncbi:MAG: hypothetical protein JF585_08235 [Burkholderiales bacterium]|nr:hypothetical protein [Burkholderiales bacterium]
MSTSPRYDPLGLSELDSGLAPESVEFVIEPAFAADSDDLPEALALPASRGDRVEARRAFVEMKQLFLHAVENLAHRKGAWLRTQVRAAEDPVDLWLLRGPLLSALREDDLATRTLRAALYRSLDHTFPEAFGGAGASALQYRF